jgi:hypothetical protein
VGGAVAAAQHLGQAGQPALVHRLGDAATHAFLHSFKGGCLVAAGVAALGTIVAAVLLPARPGTHEAELSAEGGMILPAPATDR